jgi:hypothetical protein
MKSLSSFASALALFVSVPAAAHVRLEYPPPRYPAPTGFDSGVQLKDAPCGVTGDSRTTDTSRITTFEAGETITVRFRETIGHPGHYRIAFDEDGQDDLVDPAGFDDIQDPPSLPILLDGIADNPGTGTYEVQITLPNTPCNNCTLQLIQVMTDKPPYVLGTDDVYHQCADIVLTGPGGGSGGSSGSGGTTNTGGTTNGGGTTGSGGEPSTAGSAGTGTGAGGAPAGGTGNGSGGGAGSDPLGTGGSSGPDRKPMESSSCTLGRTSGGAGAWLAASGVLALGVSLRRARRRRCARPR